MTKIAISFGAGDIKIKKTIDYCMWCLTSDIKPCVIILPKSMYQIIDENVRDVIEREHLAASVGCVGYDTPNPVFLPATMSMEVYQNYYNSLASYVNSGIVPPSPLADDFFNSVKLVEKDEVTQTIKLFRKSRNYNKADLVTRGVDGNVVDIYVMQLIKSDVQYSSKELLKLRVKALFKFFGT